jgi:hypothetical protein
LETWIKEDGLVGKEEWQGEGECVEDKGEEDQDEIRATIIDHVVNHGLSLREDGLRVQPNLELHQ